MNLSFRQIITILATLLFAINMPAQDIPVLPNDPAVLNGVMSNGMTYYLVSNPSERGVADFALVQKTGLHNSTDSARVAAAAGSAFRSLKRISGTTLKSYLTGHEVFPGKEGFVEVVDDATVFRFSNVRLSAGAQVMDSTLLIIMDLADRMNYAEDEFIEKWYSPADQAVIVSGDIDAKAVAEKLRYMSFMIPEGESIPRMEHQKEVKGHMMDISERNGLAVIEATWTSKRAPREYMNTVQPEIFEMSLNTLGNIAADRIRECLKNRDIPAGDVSYSHMCSSEYPYDDSFTIHVAVDKADAGRVRDIIVYVMSQIDLEGVMTNEYAAAEASYLQELGKKAMAPNRSNKEYVERCRNAFLYNSSLASPKERLTFHTSRNIPDTMRQRLFNGIASALIDSVGKPLAPLKEIYTDIEMADTLLVPVTPLKMKLKSIRKEPVSGGSLWTFPNGFTVVFKRMASDRMYYSLALNGGFAGIDGLGAGEGAFVADYLKMCRIAGMEYDDFVKCLAKEGITMDVKVGMSDMSVSGSLPEEEMPLLMRSLLAVANERTAGEDADFQYYKECEYMSLDYSQGSYSSRMTAVDSIMCPGYLYSPYKQKGKLTKDFTDLAENYYNRQFSKTNDGVLVLVGNMNEERLKKILLENLGHFRTNDAVSRKPVVRYQPVSGWSTYTVDGSSDNVDVAVSARMPLTMDNYMAANLASMVMRREIAKKLNEKGMYFTLTYNCRIYPEERFNAIISIPSATLDDLASIREVLSGLESVSITEADLKPFKESLKNDLSREMQSPEYWVHAIMMRYLDGKDLSSNYASKIDAVTPARVEAILDLLDEGTKIEYVTINK